MSELLNNIQVALPEIILLITASFALLSDLFFSPRCPSIAFICAAIGLVLTFFTSFLLLGHDHDVVILHGLFIGDDMAYLMKIFISVTVFLSFFYGRDYLRERQMPEGDYYVLGLFSTLGMMVMVSAHHLLTMYLGLELLSLPLYAMVAMRRTSAQGSEAAMKYFVMGAIASGMLLYGMSLMYGATGHAQLSALSDSITHYWLERHGLITFALVFIVAGIGFKLVLVPFHMWAPDVYAGAPTSVTLFISAAPKIAALAMALRLLGLTMGHIAHDWQQMVLIMALLSTGIGNLLAIAQTNIKRLFAYSAIAHMGYALFGVLAATSAGYAAALYYVLVYTLMSVTAFGLVVLMSRNGIEIEHIEDLKGLNRRNPWLAFIMMITLFSMAGVPPTVGFFTKLLVLKALVDVQMTWVAVIGLVFAVIGAFYYLRIIKVMYFDDAIDIAPLKLSKAVSCVFSLNGLTILYFGIFPNALIAVCVRAFS